MYDAESRDERPAGGTEFEVHVETLEKSAETLDDLADLIQQHMLDPMRSNLSIDSSPAGKAGLSEGDAVFGSFQAAKLVATKYKSHYDAAHASAEAMMKSLRDAAEGTRKMAKKYRDAEEASKAQVQDVERLLTGGGTQDPAAAPDPGSYTGPTTYASDAYAAAPAPAAAPTAAPAPAPAPSPSPSPSPAPTATPTATPAPSPAPTGTAPSPEGGY